MPWTTSNQDHFQSPERHLFDFTSRETEKLFVVVVWVFFILLFFLRNGYEGMPLFSDIATRFHIYTIISISLSSQVVMGMNGGQDLNV
ncbi:hypothetical protein ACRRTK_013454 [Alexandromys fortis]